MATDDLTTFAKCQTIFKPATEDESMVEALITSASKWANNFTSRKLKARDLTEYYDGDNTSTLFLDNYPVNSITTVHQDSARAFGTSTLVSSTDYVYYRDGRRNLIGVGVGWSDGIQTIKIVYNAGYETVEEDLENAILMLVDYWYKSFDTHRFGVSSVGIADQRIDYESDIPQQIKNIVQPYVKQVIF